ncbi:hypothetical protein QQG55_29130 [Brugia pahangi]
MQRDIMLQNTNIYSERVFNYGVLGILGINGVTWAGRGACSVCFSCRGLCECGACGSHTYVTCVVHARECA